MARPHNALRSMIPLDSGYIAIARLAVHANASAPNAERIPNIGKMLSLDMEKLTRYVDLVEAAKARGVLLDDDDDPSDSDPIPTLPHNQKTSDGSDARTSRTP